MTLPEFFIEVNNTRKEAKTLLNNWIQQQSKKTLYIFRDDKATALKVSINLNKVYLSTIDKAHRVTKGEEGGMLIKKLFEEYEKLIDKVLEPLTKK